MALELHPEVEALVRKRAQAEGISVDDLLSRTFVHSRVDSSGVQAERVRSLLADWQARDEEAQGIAKRLLADRATEKRPFRAWREQDASMTDHDRAEEDDLWADIERDLSNATFSVRNESAA